MKTSDIYAIFDSGGKLGESFANYEFREGQLSMALDVEKAFQENSIVAIEAGTGIGKSFAYLVPALMTALEDPTDRTVIATSTINLQRQLIDKDIPQLFNALGKKCNIALALGRNNYLCKRRLASEVSDNPLISEDPESELGRLNDFALKSESGMKSDFKGRLDINTWLSVCSDSDMCQGNKCPEIGKCFFMRAKKKVMDASIIVSNHHLLFVDSNSRLEGDIPYTQEAVLPPFRRLVIDEAHNIEKNATDLFTKEYSSYELKRQIDYVNGRRWGKKVSMLEELADICSSTTNIDQIQDLIVLCNQNAETLDRYVMSLLSTKKLAHLLIKKEQAPLLLKEYIPLAKDLGDSIQRLAAALRRFASDSKGDDITFEARFDELAVHAARIDSLGSVLSFFSNLEDWNDDVHFFDTEKRKGLIQVKTCIAPLSVARVLDEALFSKIDTVVCTSATLDLNDEFSFWSSRIGLPVEGKSFFKAIYPSPFDFKNRLMLLTPPDAPLFKEREPAEYIEYLIPAIGDSIISAGGGALVLFTSNLMMKTIYERLSPILSENGIDSLCQGQADRFQLLEVFKNNLNSVLFATDSFWEGVDAPGNTLRLVIITKLPFRMPDEPIFKARVEKIEQDGGSGFWSLQLPDATMRLKQGFGRLMRHTTDKGIVLILDSRVVKKGYGVSMLRTLPESFHPETETGGIADKIESFLF